MIQDRDIIILKQLHLSMLPRIKISLGYKMLKTMRIYENITMHTIKIIFPNLKCKTTTANSKSWVGSCLKISRRISNNSTLLHQYIIWNDLERIIIYVELIILNIKRNNRHWSMKYLELPKSRLTLLKPPKTTSFWVNLVIGAK